MGRKTGFEKRPALGTKIIILTPSRWGEGKVVGHAQLILTGGSRRDSSSPFLVRVSGWQKGRPMGVRETKAKVKAQSKRQIAAEVSRQLSTLTTSPA